MTYSTLQSDIAAYVHRTDVAGELPAMIARAEAYLFLELSLRDQETSVTGVTVGGVIVLPADFASVVRVTINVGGTERDIEYTRDPHTPTGSVPSTYALETSALRLFPAVGNDYAYTLYYTAKLSPLSDSVTTNWLLDNAPDLYLYASALEVYRFVKDANQVAAHTALLPQLIDSVRRLSERRGLPSRGGLRIRTRTAV